MPNAAPSLSLRVGSIDALARHVAKQLESFVPAAGVEADHEQVIALVPDALERMRPILAAVRNFSPGEFNHFHSLQYATFLYLLGNEQWRRGSAGDLADRLYCLNRALNSIDLFYSVCMPELFFLSHGLGAVLGNAEYGDRCVVFQNVTVGRVADAKPILGRNVVLYPGATVTGKAVIGDNCVVAAGTVVHGIEVPPDTIAKSGPDGPIFAPTRRDYAALYFRPGR